MNRSLITLLLCLISGAAFGQEFEFIDAAFEIDHDPRSIASGDLDGDSDLDLAVTGDSSVTVFFNDGSGAFMSSIVLPSFLNAQTVEMGDFDNDGDLDLVTEHFSQGRILFYRNNGDGTFQDSVTTPVPIGSTTGLAIGDYDGDLDLDLATTTLGSSLTEPGFAVVLLNDGDGSFEEQSEYLIGDIPFGVKAVDVDGDNAMDLVVWNSNLDEGLTFEADTIGILKNNGDGTFAEQAEFLTGGSASFILAAADLDGDQYVDLVTANSGSEDLSIILGNGDGTFQNPILLDFITGVIQEIVAADVDGDSDLDLAVVCSDQDTLTFLVNDGSGGFVIDSSLIFGDIPVSVTAGDFDGDGKDNLASGYTGSGLIVTLAVDCSDFVLGDTNGDGTLDLTDIGPFVDVVTAGGFVAEADINMDGYVNLVDIAPFIDLLSGN